MTQILQHSLLATIAHWAGTLVCRGRYRRTAA